MPKPLPWSAVSLHAISIVISTILFAITAAHFVKLDYKLALFTIILTASSSVLLIFMLLFGRGLTTYPPKLRFRLELESVYYSLCLALREQVEPSRLARHSLFRRSFGLWRSIRHQTKRWHTRLQSNDPQEWGRTAREMREALEGLAVGAGKRMPLGKPAMMGDGFAFQTSGKVAILGALSGVLAPDAPLVSLELPLSAFIFFHAALAVSTLVRMGSDKVHDIRSKSRFRTILITDTTELTWMASVVLPLLYARIGHAVVVFVSRSSLEPREPYARGIYSVTCAPEGLADALSAFATHGDLIVLDSTDGALAAKVRNLTNFPTDRYLALSTDGSCPTGFRWIDPRTLLLDPGDWRAKTAGVDPYLWSIRQPGLRLGDLEIFVAAFAALLFARLEHGLPLTIFFAAAILSRIIPEIVGLRRAKTLSRAVFRAPKAPATSRDLDPRKLELRLWIVVVLCFATALASFVYRTGFNSDVRWDPTKIIIFVAFWLLLFGGSSIVACTMLLRKWSLDWNFRIIVLRRNSRVFGYGHKRYVLAICGKYGQVTSIHDYELDRTDDDYGEWRESSIGVWFTIFSEIDKTKKPSIFFHVWQRQVLIEMEVVDFAVFDWIDEITDHMRWELQQALVLLPVRRILIICKPANEPAVLALLDTCLSLPKARPQLLLLERGRDDEYIWANHTEFDEKFSAALWEALAALEPEQRPQAGIVTPGAWAYPCPADRSDTAGTKQR
jgi:hypothetical protein